MRIAIYSHSIAPSIDGVCRRFTGLLHELVRQGHQILLFTLEDHPEDLPKEGLLEVVTLPHIILPAYPDKKIGRPTVIGLFRVLSALQRHKVEVVHVTSDAVSNTFSLAGLLLSVPVLASFHTDLQDLLSSHQAHPVQSFFTWLKERLDAMLLDSLATTSRSFQAKLALQGITCDYVIKTAVNREVFHPSCKSEAVKKTLTFHQPNAFLCVYVGRVSREKKIDLLVAALKPLPNAYLAIVGDGPSAATFASLHGKENRIHCLPGFKSHAELAQIYASSDVHVSASEFETLGNTVLEAHSCGIPVVVPRTQVRGLTLFVYLFRL